MLVWFSKTSHVTFTDATAFPALCIDSGCTLAPIFLNIVFKRRLRCSMCKSHEILPPVTPPVLHSNSTAVELLVYLKEHTVVVLYKQIKGLFSIIAVELPVVNNPTAVTLSYSIMKSMPNK